MRIENKNQFYTENSEIIDKLINDWDNKLDETERYEYAVGKIKRKHEECIIKNIIE
jgi:hypothetical protein